MEEEEEGQGTRPHERRAPDELGEAREDLLAVEEGDEDAQDEEAQDDAQREAASPGGRSRRARGRSRRRGR